MERNLLLDMRLVTRLPVPLQNPFAFVDPKTGNVFVLGSHFDSDSYVFLVESQSWVRMSQGLPSDPQFHDGCLCEDNSTVVCVHKNGMYIGKLDSDKLLVDWNEHPSMHPSDSDLTRTTHSSDSHSSTVTESKSKEDHITSKQPKKSMKKHQIIMDNNNNNLRFGKYLEFGMKCESLPRDQGWLTGHSTVIITGGFHNRTGLIIADARTRRILYDDDYALNTVPFNLVTIQWFMHGFVHWKTIRHNKRVPTHRESTLDDRSLLDIELMDERKDDDDDSDNSSEESCSCFRVLSETINLYILCRNSHLFVLRVVEQSEEMDCHCILRMPSSFSFSSDHICDDDEMIDRPRFEISLHPVRMKDEMNNDNIDDPPIRQRQRRSSSKEEYIRPLFAGKGTGQKWYAMSLVCSHMYGCLYVFGGLVYNSNDETSFSENVFRLFLDTSILEQPFQTFKKEFSFKGCIPEDDSDSEESEWDGKTLSREQPSKPTSLSLICAQCTILESCSDFHNQSNTMQMNSDDTHHQSGEHSTWMSSPRSIPKLFDAHSGRPRRRSEDFSVEPMMMDPRLMKEERNEKNNTVSEGWLTASFLDRQRVDKNLQSAWVRLPVGFAAVVYDGSGTLHLIGGESKCLPRFFPFQLGHGQHFMRQTTLDRHVILAETSVFEFPMIELVCFHWSGMRDDRVYEMESKMTEKDSSELEKKSVRMTGVPRDLIIVIARFVPAKFHSTVADQPGRTLDYLTLFQVPALYSQMSSDSSSDSRSERSSRKCLMM